MAENCGGVVAEIMADSWPESLRQSWPNHGGVVTNVVVESRSKSVIGSIKARRGA